MLENLGNMIMNSVIGNGSHIGNRNVINGANISTINGTTYVNGININEALGIKTINSVSCNNGRIIINGKDITDELADTKNSETGKSIFTGEIVIKIEGTCGNINTNGRVEVTGDCGDIDTNGTVNVGGNVNGDIDTNGHVTVGSRS